MPPKRDRRKQRVAAHARQEPDRDRIVNRWAAIRWVAQRIGEGALPTLGKLAAEWAWKGGAGAVVVGLWEWWWS